MLSYLWQLKACHTYADTKFTLNSESDEEPSAEKRFANFLSMYLSLFCNAGLRIIGNNHRSFGPYAGRKMAWKKEDCFDLNFLRGLF